MNERDKFGQTLCIDDIVMRGRRGEDGDFFRCHPASFGIILGAVTETHWSRPDVKAAEPGDQWIELMINPHASGMVPIGDTIIQWTPQECIRIPRWLARLLAWLWPLTRKLSTAPLDGRSTDW